MIIIYNIGGSKINKILPIIIIILLVSSFPNITKAEVSKNIIYVNDDGGADYTRIQDAIDNASDNDTIYVYGGLYKENIFISKNIILIGGSKDTTIIDGRGGKVILINYSSKNCNISNFTIRNGTYGLYIHSSSRYINIFDNIVINNTHGIFMRHNDHIKIFNNYISGKKWGVETDGSGNIDIYHNNFNHCGIKLSGWGSGNKIFENQIKDAEVAIYINEGTNTKISRNNIINENENLVKFKYFNRYFPEVRWNYNYWSDWIYPFPPYIISPPRMIEGKVIKWDPFTSEPREEKDWIDFDWFPTRKPFDLPL